MIEVLTLVSLVILLAVYLIDSFKDTTIVTLGIFSVGLLMFVVALYNALAITFSDVFIVAFAYEHFSTMYAQLLFNKESEETQDEH